MKTTEEQYIYDEYTSKKPFTIIISIGVVVAWLFILFMITFTVNACAEYIFKFVN